MTTERSLWNVLKELIRKKRREEAIKSAGTIQVDMTLEELIRKREEG